MIDNKVKGKSFSGCVKYVMNQKGAELIDTNMSGRNPPEIIAEFQLGRHLNANVLNIVFHASLSAAPGEELSNDKWKALVRDYLKGMGFDDNQYIALRHHEPEDKGKHDHAHVHIVASRVKLTGECVSDSWDYRRSSVVMKEIELQHELIPTPHHPSWEKEKRNSRKGEMQVLYKQQRLHEEGKRDSPPEPSARMKLQAIIDEIASTPTTVTNLFERLQESGIEVRIRQTRNGIIQGISFAHPDWQHGLKGSDLGRDYSWEGLQNNKRVSYDPYRDAKVIEMATLASRASTQQKMAANTSKNGEKPIDRLQEFLDALSTPDSSKSTEPALTQKESSQPTKRLQLPKNQSAIRVALDGIYQELATFVSQESPFKQIEDIDVAVARLALQENHDTKDVRRILLLSPKNQDFQHADNPAKEFSDYRKQRVAIAISEKQLAAEPIEQKRVDIVQPIVQELFKTVESGQQLVDKNYTLKRERDTRSVIAHDGRGEVLRLNGRWVEHCSLTDKDVLLWQQARENRNNTQRQGLLQSSTSSPNQSSQRQPKQVELD